MTRNQLIVLKVNIYKYIIFIEFEPLREGRVMVEVFSWRKLRPATPQGYEKQRTQIRLQTSTFSE
jgi:hypothetical protein